MRLPPGYHLLLADGAFLTGTARIGQLHAEKKRRIQSGHCRLRLLFLIAQLIEIVLAGMPFVSRIVVIRDRRAGEVTVTPRGGPNEHPHSVETEER
jgi:hypothetical protein